MQAFIDQARANLFLMLCLSAGIIVILQALLLPATLDGVTSIGLFGLGYLAHKFRRRTTIKVV